MVFVGLPFLFYGACFTFDALLPLGGAHLVYAYIRNEAGKAHDLHVRMFTERMVEEPATGSATEAAAGINATLSDIEARGWNAAFCSILADDSAEATIAASLAERWDCIVIGGGIRIPSRGLHLFERVINAVHRGALGTLIAFNTFQRDSADAAARWIDRR